MMPRPPWTHATMWTTMVCRWCRDPMHGPDFEGCPFPPGKGFDKQWKTKKRWYVYRHLRDTHPEWFQRFFGRAA